MDIFDTSEEAFEFLFDSINTHGTAHSGANAIFNKCFTILNPVKNEINTPWRKWYKSYAKQELEWYRTGDPNIKAFEIIRGDKEVPAIWYDHADENGDVRSNYGHQWMRNGQLDYVISELTRSNESRRALVTLYDGKEHTTYTHDTPCTLNYHFQIVNDKLNLTVMMRSNDLVFGFCNDQFVASELMIDVAQRLGKEVGELCWFASNLHIYPVHKNLRTDWKDGIKKRI